MRKTEVHPVHLVYPLSEVNGVVIPVFWITSVVLSQKNSEPLLQELCLIRAKRRVSYLARYNHLLPEPSRLPAAPAALSAAGAASRVWGAGSPHGFHRAPPPSRPGPAHMAPRAALAAGPGAAARALRPARQRPHLPRCRSPGSAALPGGGRSRSRPTALFPARAPARRGLFPSHAPSPRCRAPDPRWPPCQFRASPPSGLCLSVPVSHRPR